jgi:hypothetical protein
MEVRAWFRQEGEPQRAYEAFCWYVYLPSESRSIEEAYKAAHPRQKSVGSVVRIQFKIQLGLEGPRVRRPPFGAAVFYARRSCQKVCRGEDKAG